MGGGGGNFARGWRSLVVEAPCPGPSDSAKGVLGEGESTCSLSTCSGKEDHLLGYHAGPRSQVLILQRPPPFREGRGLARHVPACSKDAKDVLGPGGGGGRVGPVTLSVPLLLGRGWPAKDPLPCLKVRSPVSWSPTWNQPTACTLALWWLKFGPTGGGGGGLPKASGWGINQEWPTRGSLAT